MDCGYLLDRRAGQKREPGCRTQLWHVSAKPRAFIWEILEERPMYYYWAHSQ
jgi:hypothetical protein